MRSKIIYNRVLIYTISAGMIALISAVVCVCGPFAGSPAETARRGPGEILETRTLGRAGNVDAFLTDVVPGWPGWSRHYWTDKELWGNQGYIIGGPAARLIPGSPVEVGLTEDIDLITETEVVPSVPVEKIDLDAAAEKPGTHRVVKGECLWYIAGYEHIYGNPLQWPLIYKANKYKIKNPDLIYPGQVFIIPRD